MKFAKTLKTIILATACIGVPLAFQTITAPVAIAQASSAKQIVDAAKAKGEVGETIAGYLDFVTPNVSSEVRKAVNEINIRRKSLYTQVARETGAQVAEVARIAGEKQIFKAAREHKIMRSLGQWENK